MASVNPRHLRVIHGGDAREPDGPAEGAPAVTLDDAFRAHAGFIASIALRLLGRPSDVDDLVQDVFLRALDRLGDLRDPAALRSWLAVITVRIARRRLRARRWRVWLGVGADHDYAQLADASLPPDDRALLGELYRRLDRLPVRQRLAWSLRRIEGLDLAAIAETCECSIATVKREVAAADAALRAALQLETP